MTETIDGQPRSKTVGKQTADALLALISRLAEGPASIDDLHAAVCEADRKEPSRRTTYRYLEALRRAGYDITRGPAYELLDHPLKGWRPRPAVRRQLTEERNRAAASKRAASRKAGSPKTGSREAFLRLPGLRERRRAAGYTLRVLGDQTGLSGERIRQLETKAGGTRPEIAARIAQVLGVAIEDLRSDQTETWTVEE